MKYFLEQCLCSVRKAIQHIEAEVFVADNNSSDGSIDYLKPKFSFVQFIINKENLGFSKANNKALAIAKGKYILFLNPDTIVAEDSFEKCIQFLDSNPDAGALGVKMIDGSGNYLKESKRGFPSPWVSFCKLSGLTCLFPHSKFFAKYYFGNLSEKENQIIDSISGAFFFGRKEVLDKTGGFDEQFFMYAEDIDLSYRVQQAGYKNYYFSETVIIHFKGESTKKDFKYVAQFYKAMAQFSKKHFSKFSSSLFSSLINIFIGFRRIFSSGNKQESKVETNINLFLYGDNNACDSLKKILVHSKMKVVEQETNADGIIFCEGENYSFKNIIEKAQALYPKKKYLFYSESSLSIVSSNQKDALGFSLDLYS